MKVEQSTIYVCPACGGIVERPRYMFPSQNPDGYCVEADAAVTLVKLGPL